MFGLFHRDAKKTKRPLQNKQQANQAPLPSLPKLFYCHGTETDRIQAQLLIFMLTLRIARGRCMPLGASATPEGVNFSLLCRHGTAAFLVLFSLDGTKPLAEIALHPRRNRTGDHWHVLVAGLPPAFNYGWRVDGPSGNGHCFDPGQVLLDPSATAVSHGARWGQAEDTNPRFTTRRSVYLRSPFHWQEDVPLVTPLEDSIIYELHVRGFTCHGSSLTAHPGTFAGLMEKISYLQALGITAVELLPIHEFDECDCPFINPTTGERLRNFWGYNSIAFAAPKAAYASTGGEHGQLTEFREMVRAFHAAGIEVYLDVVFNHTGEGDQRGRTYSYRGLDNKLYYMIGPDGRYLNFSGCGNTVQLQSSGDSAIADELSALLGRRHARGWIAFRFSLGDGTRLSRAACCTIRPWWR